MLLDRGAEIPDYDAIRTGHLLYVEYGNGEHELYDLRTDPDELTQPGRHPPGVGAEAVASHRPAAPLRRQRVSEGRGPARGVSPRPDSGPRPCCYDALPQVRPSPHRLVAQDAALSRR